MFLLTVALMTTVYASVVLGTYAEVANDDPKPYEYPMDYLDRLHQRMTYEPGFKLVLISTLVGSSIQCVLNSLLLLGVSKERRSLLLTWLVSYTILLGLCILGFVIGFFRVPFSPVYQIAVFVNIVLYTYFLLVVRSYRFTLPDGQHAAMLIGGEETNIKPVFLQ